MSDSTSDDPSPEISTPPAFIHTSETLNYVVTHVFIPIEHPEETDYTVEKDLALARAVYTAACAYGIYVSGTSEKAFWCRITKMLDNLQTSTQSECQDRVGIISQLREMQTRDILSFFVRRENTAVVLTKQENCTLCESFEVSPSRDAVERTLGPLVYSYPASAVEIPNEVFDEGDFLFKLANLLSHPDAARSNLPLPPSPHPQYASILRGVGRTADVPQISKRVHDCVGRGNGCHSSSSKGPWRRSSLWLFIRVAIQISADRSPLGGAAYKRFMLFFICTLSMDRNNIDLSSDLLYFMSSKILRRLSKLNSSTPNWLSRMALETRTRLREILDARWERLNIRSSPFRNPSQDELVRDTQLSLLDSREYICKLLTNPEPEIHNNSFHPSHHRHSTIENFLSSDGSLFDEACGIDPHYILYDVERSIEQGIDDWVSCVTNVDEASARLEILMNKYMTAAAEWWKRNPEDTSIMLLTAIEFYVALDKLVVKEIPMLADYPPEIPVVFLEKLLLRKAMSLHRLSRAYQYLFARHSQSRPGWSVVSNDFTEDSFPVRYYNQSPWLQNLKARIEYDTTGKDIGRVTPERGCASLTCTQDGHRKCRQHPSERQLAESAQVSKSPLPSLLLHAKVAVFELQCPPCVRIWRSTAARILLRFNFYIFDDGLDNGKEEYHLFVGVPALQPYLVEHQIPPGSVQVYLAYFYPNESCLQNGPLLRYVVDWFGPLTPWRRKEHYEDQEHLIGIGYWHEEQHSPHRGLARYMRYTSHTPNDVLSTQLHCPADFPLDEFIAFADLRGGGSLQWLNILRGLRSRTLNLRRHHVHYLLAYAAFQVGPLDLDTGTWIWHQELQDASFCNALLDELEDLFMDVGAGSIDGVLMNSVSLLLTRVLASSSGEDVDDRAIALLRSVRRKTFSWVQELAYDLSKAPTNEDRMNLLQIMAATCRSTFNVDPAILRKYFHSAEDVDALLSCAFFIYTLRPTYYSRYLTSSNSSDIKDGYTRLLHQRDHRLSFILEGILRDVIIADPSDYGVDLAIRKAFPRYRPATCRWEKLQHPSAPWLTCEIKATVDQPSQTMHIHLLDGELRVNGQILGGLPPEIKYSPECQQIFRDQGFFVIPSSLLGMEFTTPSTMSKHEVHFSLRDGDLVLQARCNRTNDILALIPSSKLREDLPSALVDGHVHWLNLSTNILEIRPLEQLWEESPQNWRIDCTSGQYRMYRDRIALVDIRSPTWRMVSRCFECLTNINEGWQNQSTNLVVTTTLVDSIQSARVLQLSVTLPRYSLSFFVNEGGELESCDFRNMVYDEDQCVGALLGLESLLVLRPKTRLGGTSTPEPLSHRRVLMPNGDATVHSDHQVRIDIQWFSHIDAGSDKPLYHAYDVDTELGCLVGNGGLASTRFLAHIHAMTSRHRPDSLTGKTGAQAALCLLQSAACRSIVITNSLDYNPLWIPCQNEHQVDNTYMKIQDIYYWPDRTANSASAPEKHSGQQTGYLFPLNSFGVPAEPGLSTLPDLRVLDPRFSFDSMLIDRCNPPRQIALNQLFCTRAAPKLSVRNSFPQCNGYTTSPDNVLELDMLFSSLRTDRLFQWEYLAHLDGSLQHARMGSQSIHRMAREELIESLEEYYGQCKVRYLDSLDILKKSLGPMTGAHEQTPDRSRQWPPITADILLRYLASTSPFGLPGQWKKCLVSLALLLLDLQRSRRLLRFALDGLEEELWKELENEGCDGWDAEEYPDWLLIQIQGNFLIRRAQAETATELMSPQSGRNTVMQLNMGEGKSSVIIPIAAAVLADGKQLVRVIVPKALTAQMFELLILRLGGLVNRPIYHLPFSRTPEYNESGEANKPQIYTLCRLMDRCVVERGILLIQPEHAVSLKLMSVKEQIIKAELAVGPLSMFQNLIDKHVKTALLFKSIPRDSFVGNMFRLLRKLPHYLENPDTTRADSHGEHGQDPHGPLGNAQMWLTLQKWIHSYTRDILDESDEILHARFQLVYTIGSQQHMDGYPDRWTVIQQVLRLVKKHVSSLSRHNPGSIEYECGPPGSFPRVRVVQATEIGRLTSLIVEDVMAGRIPNFNFRHVRPELLSAIRSFISDRDILQVPDTAKWVEEYAKHSDQSHLWGGLLLLRGLLTSKTLFFALAERRWRVDYGLPLPPKPREHLDHSGTPTAPTMLAIPYRAKDLPAANTQFGHPDLTIILTCLSYYYTGLKKEQLRMAFEILLDQDDPTTEYALWVKEYDRESMPQSLQKLSEINLKSSELWDDVIFPLFTRNQATVDFYLSQVVFPKEAKEFPSKLSGSSWDLAEKKDKLVTGFSGTSDGRWLLPTSIAQCELDHQKGTNARVLAYLLRPENNFYTVTHKNGERQSTYEFLRTVATQQPEVRVLLDVGALILDFSNRQVAATWLDLDRCAAGAIYFNEDNELRVLTRSGITQPLLSSSLSQWLDRCVVYLDHAHTRGTDVKLPIGSRAAVTLGPKVTKDALVQGCMRMRKLGRGHSVMFFAPLEVDRSIRTMAGKQDQTTQVTTADILCWTINETWTEIEQRAPHWAKQGMSHKLRYDTWSNFCNNTITSEQLSDVWLQPDGKSLVDLYAPRENRDPSSTLAVLDPVIRQRCKDLGVLSLPSAQMDEEQEREVNREREREREVELPPKGEPVEHFLHPDVVDFVRTGAIPPLQSSSAFLPVFRTLERSSAATCDADVWSPFILATADFCKTVKPESTRGTMDQYLRPVQWILSCRNDHDQVLVLLSPFEANLLLPDIRVSEHVHLHLYAPRTSQRMKPSDDLRLYSIPPLSPNWTPPWDLIDQLNVFAGQLYLRNYDSYLRLCQFLGVPTKETHDDTVTIRRNMFNIPGSFEDDEITFSGSPLPSVMALTAIRSRGRPFAHTHMGKILQGKILTRKDF